MAAPALEVYQASSHHPITPPPVWNFLQVYNLFLFIIIILKIIGVGTGGGGGGASPT